MAYTPPSGTGLGLDFSDSYTPPSGGGLSLGFVESGETVFTIAGSCSTFFDTGIAETEFAITAGGAVDFGPIINSEGYFNIFAGGDVLFANAFADIWVTDVAGTSLAEFTTDIVEDRDFTSAGSAVFTGRLAPQIVEVDFTSAGLATPDFIAPEFKDRDFTFAGAATTNLLGSYTVVGEFTNPSPDWFFIPVQWYAAAEDYTEFNEPCAATVKFYSGADQQSAFSIAGSATLAAAVFAYLDTELTAAGSATLIPVSSTTTDTDATSAGTALGDFHGCLEIASTYAVAASALLVADGETAAAPVRTHIPGRNVYVHSQRTY